MKDLSTKRFRCPYCKAELDDLSSNKCPKCGRVMTVKRKSDSNERRERRKKIERIHAAADMKRRELGGAVKLERGPLYYGVIVAAMVAALVFALTFSTNSRGGIDQRPVRALEQLNLLAEALGRFYFHTGVYPEQKDGFTALTWIETGRIPGYNGPYIENRYIAKDPWKNEWRYEAPEEMGGLPKVYSVGADGIAGTDDDIVADTNCFYRAGLDTSWTNKWVPYADRGITIVPNREIQKRMLEERKRNGQ